MGVAGAPSAFTEELRGNLGLWGAREWGARNASRRKGLPVRSPGARVLQDPPLGPENFFHRRHFCSEVASSIAKHNRDDHCVAAASLNTSIKHLPRTTRQQVVPKATHPLTWPRAVARAWQSHPG